MLAADLTRLVSQGVTPGAVGPADATTPAELLAASFATGATQPRLTWYDDAPGPTQGERIELSGRVLATWSAKAANLLVDDLGVERGDVVALDLPTHWRSVYWALAAWRLGAVVTLADDAVAAVLVTDSTEPRGVAPQVVSVSLPALARRWAGGVDGTAPLPPGAHDEAADLPGQPDVFDPYDDPGPDDAALASPRGHWTSSAVLERSHALSTARGWQPGERVAVLCPLPAGSPAAQLADVLVTLLAVWTLGGSAVLVRGVDPADADAIADRLAAERVTSACGPAGTPAARW